MRDLLHAELLTVEVTLHQSFVGLDDRVEKLLPVLVDLILQLGRNVRRTALALPLGIHVRAHVQEIDDSGQLVFGADRQMDGNAPVGKLRPSRFERAEEVCALAVEHVDEQDA